MARQKKWKIPAIIAIIAGIIILIWPKILAAAIGLYLVLVGILELLNRP